MNITVGAKQQLLLNRLGGGPAGRLVMALLTTAREIDAACATLLSRYALSEGRLAALLAIDEQPGTTPGTLAARIDVSRATVTGLIDGLVRQELVTRDGDPGDRRSLSLRLTPAGQELVAALTPQYAAWLGGLSAEVSAADESAALRALGEIQRALGGDTRPEN